MTNLIGYLGQAFPTLSTTFVYREVMALRKKGLSVATFSIWRPQEEKLSAEAKPLVGSTFYVFPLDWSRFVACHLRYMVSRPTRYFGTLLFCLMRTQGSWKNRLRTLIHFFQGVYLAEEIERQKVDHLHVHFALTPAMVASRLSGVPFSFTAHAVDIFADTVLRAEKISSAAMIIAPSDHNTRYLYNIVPHPTTMAKIKVVRYGIDTKDFAPMENDSASGKPTIVSVGRLVEKKGFRYLIEACKILVDHGYDFECQIIGEGPEEPMLRKLIQDHKLEGHVHLVGAVLQERLKDYLRRADVTTLPCVVAKNNDMDGIPNSLIEGMAMGLPAVSTHVSGIPELIDHLENGLLVPPNDATTLAHALALLLDNEELRRKLGNAAREKVVREYDLDTNTDKLLNHFRSIVRSKPDEEPAMPIGASWPEARSRIKQVP